MENARLCQLQADVDLEAARTASKIRTETTSERPQSSHSGRCSSASLKILERLRACQEEIGMLPSRPSLSSMFVSDQVIVSKVPAEYIFQTFAVRRLYYRMKQLIDGNERLQ